MQALRGLSLVAHRGQMTCVMGRSGAGKATMLRAVMGQVATTQGSITLTAPPSTACPAHEVPRHGIGYVSQGRRLFGELSVAQKP